MSWDMLSSDYDSQGEIRSLEEIIHQYLEQNEAFMLSHPSIKLLCRDPGSNRGPLDLQSNALPTELSRLV